jgi:hypothetical protein
LGSLAAQMHSLAEYEIRNVKTSIRKHIPHRLRGENGQVAIPARLHTNLKLISPSPSKAVRARCT